MLPTDCRCDVAAFCRPSASATKLSAAEHHMGMLEARERQPEVIEPVIERLTRDRDAKPPCR